MANSILDDPFQTDPSQLDSAGILSMLQQPQQQNIWQVVSAALGNASKAYGTALADPQTRKLAFASGATAAGDVLRDRLNPYTSPEDRLKRILTMSQIQKNLQDPNTKPGEAERLTNLLTTMDQKDPRYPMLKERLDFLTKRSDTGQPDIERLQQYLATLPENDPRRPAVLDAINKAVHFAPAQNTNVRIVNPNDPALAILAKQLAPKVEGNVMDLSTELASLDNVRSHFDEKFGRMSERTKQYTNTMRDWASDIPFVGKYLGLNDTEKKDLVEYSTYQSALGEYNAAKIHALYGSALSAGEQARADTILPQPGESPTVTKSKLDNASAVLHAAIARQQYALAHGIPIDNPDTLVQKGGSISDWLRKIDKSELAGQLEGPATAAPAAPATAGGAAPAAVAAPAGPAAGAAPPGVAGPAASPPALPTPTGPAAPSGAPGGPAPNISNYPVPASSVDAKRIGSQMLADGVPADQVRAWALAVKAKLGG